MKRAIIVFFMLCFIVPVTMEAKKKPFGNGLFWELSDDGILTISGSGDMPNYKWSVTGRGKWINKAPWYSDSKKIKKVIVCEGITSIGNTSFSGRGTEYNIQEVILPSSLRAIGDDAFRGQRGLNQISFNNGLEQIGNFAFYACGLKEINLPTTLKLIGEASFDSNPIEMIDMSANQSLTDIPRRAFANCKALREVLFPSNMKRIEENAFAILDEEEHGELESIIIPDGVVFIGKNAFCGNRASILSLPTNIKEIGNNAFSYSSLWGLSPKRYYNGEILSLPSFITIQNAKEYGLEQSSVSDYYNTIRDDKGNILLSAKDNQIVTKKTGDNGDIVCYIVDNNIEKGVLNPNGEWIIPMDKDISEIDLIENEYFVIKRNVNYGIVTLAGKEMIQTSRGYTSISYDRDKRTFAFTKKGFMGVCDTQGREISTTRLAPTADNIKANGGYASAVEMKNGSTKYYKVSKSGRYGLTDSEGKEIVPCEMEALESAGTGYLKYKINGFWGVMNYAGKIIIDTDRGYTSIGNFVTFTKRFPYTMTGYKGECDINGHQISKIKVETPKQAVASSSSPSSSPSSSSASSSSNSSSSNSNSGTTTVVVEHHRDPVPVQEWVQCTACWGSTVCPNCAGSGTIYIGSNLHRCSRCNGRKICTSCSGKGGRYYTVYR